MALTLILAGLVGLMSVVVLYFSWNFDYWKKRNVPFINPFALSTIMSNGLGVLPWSKPFWLICQDVYWKFKDQRYAGFFQARRPALIVRDPELIKLVLTKDFSSFHDRGVPYDEDGDPLSANLLSLEGERWKYVRSKLSPTFTSGKMKLMFHLMVEVSDELKAILQKSAANKEDVEMKDLLMRYSTDIIGSCAFGVHCNSLKDPQSEFYLMGREVFRSNFVFLIRFILVSINPKLVKLLPFKRLFSKATDFFLNLMKETVEFREKNSIERNDFVNLMMQLRDSGNEDDGKSKLPVRFGETQMAAEAFLFFIAGLDSIANTVGFCLHELALNEDLERSVAEEVRETVRKHDGQITYEALREMDLVERVILEALRKYSPGAVLTRIVSEPLKFPGSDFVLDTVPQVWIPVWEIHHDPAYYPDPERFDPDRFTEEAKQARHPYAFMPFGEGPRICIAQRFAMLEMKLCLASLLRDFCFTKSQKTSVNLEMYTKAFSPTPKNGFWLKVAERT